jgi:hypothetical protein
MQSSSSIHGDCKLLTTHGNHRAVRMFDAIAAMDVIVSPRDIIPIIVDYVITIEAIAILMYDDETHASYIHLWSPSVDDAILDPPISSASTFLSQSWTMSYRIPDGCYDGYNISCHVVNDTLLIMSRIGGKRGSHLLQLPNLSHHMRMATRTAISSATPAAAGPFSLSSLTTSIMGTTAAVGVMTLGKANDWITRSITFPNYIEAGSERTSVVIHTSPSSLSQLQQRWLCMAGTPTNKQWLVMIRVLYQLVNNYDHMHHTHYHLVPSMQLLVYVVARMLYHIMNVYLMATNWNCISSYKDSRVIHVYDPAIDRWFIMQVGFDLGHYHIVATSTYGIVAISNDMYDVRSITNITTGGACGMNDSLLLTCTVTTLESWRWFPPMRWHKHHHHGERPRCVSASPISLYNGDIIVVLTHIRPAKSGMYDIIWMDTISQPGMAHGSSIRERTRRHVYHHMLTMPR